MPIMKDHNRFVTYYEGQVGGSEGFYGAPVMYGRGLGSIFSKLFRFVSPLMKKGFSIAKPHLKTAAQNLASDVFSRVANKFTRTSGEQEGSGVMMLARRARKRPPGQRVITPKSKKSRSFKRRKTRGRTSKSRSHDIF